MPIISVKNLSYVYSAGTPYKRDAVTDVCFDINEGEIVGIIGHTGSGKSTLVQQLNGLLKPSSGQIFFDGLDIWEKPKEIRAVRFKVGLVFQYPEYQLFADTVYEDIAFGPKNMGLSDDEINTRVMRASKLVELPENLLSKSPFDLSGGEKRRAAIAGVIAMEPKVLIMDEPTAGLDPKGRAVIFRLIKKYREETGAAVIFVSHNMEDVAALSERVLVMQKGKIAMFDSCEKVFESATKLTEMGLDVPDVTKITMYLKKQGINIKNSYTVADAAQAILKIYGEKMNGGNINAQ